MAKRIVIALLLLPVAEVAAFLLVVWAIGFFPAIALMILTSLAGGLVLRHAGLGQIAKIRGTMRQRGIAGTAAGGGGLMFTLGGILLLLPGFITDLIGLGLLVGPIRRQLGAAIGRALDTPRRPRDADAVIDLAPGEWRDIPDREPPRQKRKPTGKSQPKSPPP